jgi:hypothetical protein
VVAAYSWSSLLVMGVCNAILFGLLCGHDKLIKYQMKGIVDTDAACSSQSYA